MRILFASFTFFPAQNGVANVCLQQALGLQKLGYDVTVATNFLNNHVFALVDGVKIEQFRSNSSQKEEVLRYQNLLINSGFDVIFFQCHNIWTLDWAFPVFTRIRAKKILISHGFSGTKINFLGDLYFNYRPKVLKYRYNLKEILCRFDHLIFLSEKMDSDRFLDFCVAKENSLTNYSIIPNGTKIIDYQTDKSFRLKHNITADNLILCVSAFIKSKNPMMCLSAFEKSESKANSVLVFIGNEKNSYSQKLENYSSSKSLNIKVLEHQTEQDIFAAYFSANLFLFGSVTEVQPLVILDAMGAGVPFISTNVGCVDLLKGGFTVDSTTEMALKIDEILQNKSLHAKLSEFGREDVKANYIWPKIIAEYDKLIKTLY
jgi:glycosyltransferase involved in cell wall biosynthesis